MTANYIADVVPRHDIAMHICLALCAIESADLDLPYKLFARRALFRSVVFVHSNDDIAQGSSLCANMCEY
jgi:hypothetical protein